MCPEQLNYNIRFTHDTYYKFVMNNFTTIRKSKCIETANFMIIYYHILDIIQYICMHDNEITRFESAYFLLKCKI